MIKITYKSASVECSTKEEAGYVLDKLNEIRKANATQVTGLTTRVDVSQLLRDRDISLERSGQAKPKPKVI